MIDMERMIIGSILVENSMLYEMYDKLTPEMFQNDFYREVYENMLVLFDFGKSINHIELSARLENPQRKREIIIEGLADCLKDSAPWVVVKSAVDNMILEYKAMTVKNLLLTVNLKAASINTTIGYLITELEAIGENKKATCKDLKQIVVENRGNYFIEKKSEGITTGFYKLDDTLGELEGGDVTVIAARPAVGKSALVTQIIGQVAKKGKRIGYFNLEMNENQVYERFVSRLSQLNLTRVRRAKAFLKGEEEQFTKANDELMTYDVVISTGSKAISEIKAESRHQKFDLIVIDYLQLVKPDRRYANRASEVGDISKAIKALAMELKVPIILLSQLNRVSEGRNNKEPEISELRESGDIEQDASNIILLWNLSEDVPRAKGLKIGKCRQGELGKIGLEFIGNNMEFKERSESFDKYLNRIKSESRNKFSETTLTPFDGGNW